MEPLLGTIKTKKVVEFETCWYVFADIPPSSKDVPFAIPKVEGITPVQGSIINFYGPGFPTPSFIEIDGKVIDLANCL